MDLGSEKAAKSANKAVLLLKGKVRRKQRFQQSHFAFEPSLVYGSPEQQGQVCKHQNVLFCFPCGGFILHSVFSLGQMLPVTWLIISSMKCTESFEFKHDTLRSPWQALSLTLGPTGAVFGFFPEKDPVSRICCWRHQEVYTSHWEFVLKVLALLRLQGAPLSLVWNMHLLEMGMWGSTVNSMRIQPVGLLCHCIPRIYHETWYIVEPQWIFICWMNEWILPQKVLEGQNSLSWILGPGKASVLPRTETWLCVGYLTEIHFPWALDSWGVVLCGRSLLHACPTVMER